MGEPDGVSSNTVRSLPVAWSVRPRDQVASEAQCGAGIGREQGAVGPEGRGPLAQHGAEVGDRRRGTGGGRRVPGGERHRPGLRRQRDGRRGRRVERDIGRRRVRPHDHDLARWIGDPPAEQPPGGAHLHDRPGGRCVGERVPELGPDHRHPPRRHAACRREQRHADRGHVGQEAARHEDPGMRHADREPPGQEPPRAIHDLDDERPGAGGVAQGSSAPFASSNPSSPGRPWNANVPEPAGKPVTRRDGLLAG